MYSFYKSLGHAESSHFSLVVSWQRIFNNLTLTIAHIKSSFHMLSLLFTGWLSTDNWTTTELSIQSQSQSYVTTDGQSASLSWVSSTQLGLTTRFLLLSESCGFIDVAVILGSKSWGLVTIFYCLRLETLPTWTSMLGESRIWDSKSIILLLSTCYIASGRITAKKTHSIVACVYCGRCLEMGLLYCWLRICCRLLYRSIP
jgi:hypothetical protein